MTLPNFETTLETLIETMRAAMDPDATWITLSADADKLAKRLVASFDTNKTVYPFGTLTILPDDTLKSFNHAPIVLIDAVLSTGEVALSVAHLLRAMSIRAPIFLVALADRGGRTVPIEADICAENLAVGEDLSLNLNDDATDWVVS